MGFLDSNNGTLNLTADEYASVRVRLLEDHGGRELARIAAEAQPSEQPVIEPVYGEPDENGERAMVAEVVYEYAITVPPADLDVAEDVLRAEGQADLADAVAAFELPTEPGPLPMEPEPQGLVLVG